MATTPPPPRTLRPTGAAAPGSMSPPSTLAASIRRVTFWDRPQRPPDTASMAQPPPPQPPQSFARASSAISTASAASEETPPVQPLAANPPARADLRLDFQGHGLTSVPSDLVGYAQPARVKALNLARNDLSALPPRLLMRFSALRHLDLSRNRLTHLPETLRYCSQLTWLDLTANFALATLATQSGPYAQASDNVLAALVRLRHLGLGECDLTAIPASFGLLVSLTQLSAFGNRLSLIPPELGRLKRLTRLDLSANRLCEVPPELGQLRALEWLHLGENQIVYLPDEFANLISLQELGLGDNQLVSLPDLSPLCHLTSLILHTNRLTVLPPTICHLASLTRLDLAHNRLVALPPALWTLPCLETLYLQGNSTLTRLPARFHYLPAGPASQSTQSFQAASSAAAGGRHPFSVALPGGTRIPSSSMHRPLPRPPALVMTRLDVAATGLQALPWPLAAVQWRTLRLFEPSNLTRPASDLRSALVTIPTPTGGGGSIPQQQQQRAAVELLATERPRAPPRLTTLALNAVLMAHPIFHAAAAATTAPRPSPADTPSTSGHRRTHHHSLATPGRSGGDAGQKSDRDGSSARSTQFLTPTTSTTTGSPGAMAARRAAIAFGWRVPVALLDALLGDHGWAPPRRCDECLGFFLTDGDVEAMQVGVARPGSSITGNMGTGAAVTDPWYRALATQRIVLPDYRDVPIEFQFCQARCLDTWIAKRRGGGA